MNENLNVNITANTTQAQKELQNFDKRIQRMRQGFQGWALSLMFTGMAIQRAFSGMSKFGIKTFDDIAHSVQGFVTENDKLQGSMTYLGYTIGEALQPALALLIPIVDAIANWVAENPKLTVSIIGLATALGGLLVTGGMFVLTLVAIKDAFMVLFGLNIVTWLTSVGGLVGFIAGAFRTVLVVIGMLTAPISLLIIGLVAAFAWIGYMIYKSGGFLQFLENVLKGLGRVWAVIGSVIAGVFAEIINGLKMAWNGLVSLVEGGLNLMINAANKLADILGLNRISPVDFSGAKFNTSPIGNSFSDAYSAGMTDYLNLESSIFGSGNNKSSQSNVTNISVGTIKSDAKSVDELIKELTKYSNQPMSKV